MWTDEQGAMNRQRAKANSAVNRAIKQGLLIPHSACELCGSLGQTVGHHWNGYNQDNSLDVWWVCLGCNAALRGCHNGQLLKEEAAELIENDQKPYTHLRCKGKTIKGNCCQVVLTDGANYCRDHDPTLKRCQATISSGERCNKGASFGDFCHIHHQKIIKE